MFRGVSFNRICPFLTYVLKYVQRTHLYVCVLACVGYCQRRCVFVYIEHVALMLVGKCSGLGGNKSYCSERVRTVQQRRGHFTSPHSHFHFSSTHSRFLSLTYSRTHAESPGFPTQIYVDVSNENSITSPNICQAAVCLFCPSPFASLHSFALFHVL